ncbi:MAG: pyruvate dehydrogenase subunit beta [Porticoccaceae bacterium]|nr:MAG: pyruvate dehydrogenase subunit beta [Porticoccaceae bacterium]
MKSIREVINEVLHAEMARDEAIVVLGEDVAGGMTTEGAGGFGGAFGFYSGLYERFGSERVIDCPISEASFVGAAVGAAMTGLRPVIDLQFFDFMTVCYDQLANQMAKLRYMTGGQFKLPLVMISLVGAGLRAGAQHSQSLHPPVVALPGLKVVTAADAYDAKGLLSAAIRDDDPVIFLLHKTLLEEKAEVPEEDYQIPFGEARFLAEGDDVTVVATLAMRRKAEAACARLAAEAGIAADLIDPRTLSPLDVEAIAESVEVTGRLLIVDESTPCCGIAQEIASAVAQHCFEWLRAPIRVLSTPFTPVPFSPALEDLYLPTERQIENSVRALLADESASVLR